MKTFVLFTVIALGGVLADNPPQSYQPTYPDAPAQYSFDWQVKDDYSQNDFGQQEERDGDNTKGSYYVQLPDGRLQRVDYRVNGYGGFEADVSYEGEAKYEASSSNYSPQYQPAPEPKYQPAPEPKYRPAPEPKYRPAPAPEPKYQPAPAPAPEPKYQPAPAPAPEPKYRPAPAPAPEPKYQPAPAPAPEPKYQPAPAPAPEPKYQPAPAPAPAPSYEQPTPSPVYYKPAPSSAVKPEVYYKPLSN